MKVKAYFLFLLMQMIFINGALAEEVKIKIDSNKDSKVDTFDNKTHLSWGIANFMQKVGISRDLNKDIEIGLNGYYGSLSSYEFKKLNCCMGVQNTAGGYSVELDVKNYFNRVDYSEKFRNLIYSKAFLGTSFVNRYYHDPKVDGDISTYYLGLGLGDTIYLNKIAFNFAFDIGINTDISYNAIAFILFPRLLVGVETNF